MDANILSGLVKAHSKGKNGSFRAVKYIYDSVQQTKRVFVVGKTMQFHAGRINDL